MRPKTRVKNLLWVVASGLGSVLTLTLLMVSAPASDAAPVWPTQIPSGDRPPGPAFVKSGGSGLWCLQDDPCDSIQYAIDESEPGNGDTIYIAAGTYTGTGGAVISVTKSITLYGGWDGTTTTPPVCNPIVYPTMLDGQGQRRGIYVNGDPPPTSGKTVTPTLDGLQVTNGSADEGGGVCILNARPVISGCRIFSNVADAGGGIYLYGVRHGMLAGNVVASNTATIWVGGGVYLYSSEGAQLTGNVVYSNVSPSAGGIYLGNSARAIVEGNQVYSNSVTVWYGGGMLISTSPNVTLADNVIHDNSAYGDGGGLHVEGSAGAIVVGNQVYSNTTSYKGGGIYVSECPTTTLTGNTVYSNAAASPGGGICVDASPTTTLVGNTVYGNAASDAGGVYLHESHGTTLTDNRIYRNRLTTYKHGGGVYLSDSNDVALIDNWVYSNTARYGGGGLYLDNSFTVTLAGNQVMSNTTENDDGGGVHVAGGSVTLTHNTVRHNTSFGYGGGLSFSNARATIEANTIQANVAGSEAGIEFEDSTATLVNNMVVDNVKIGFPCASGIGIVDSAITLTHNTIARNRGITPTSGIYVAAPVASASIVNLINNILVSHTVGITVAAGNTATLEATLWGDGVWANGTPWGGAGGIFTGAVNIWGEPDFVDPDGGDYHIGHSSAAIDQGVDAGIATDIDGEHRPSGPLPDVGADEVSGWRLFLPAVLRYPSP
jgi:fibronectin-binding autotransporter adhesin